MIHYYTNREISKLLDINLAKWKRWSRSFLPPDPLGGMQSGYARQYTFKDSFKVFLGGYLLSHLKLSVAESKQVIGDLSPWLKKEGFLRLNGLNTTLLGNNGKSGNYRIYFCSKPVGVGKPKTSCRYLIRKTTDTDRQKLLPGRNISETYAETTIPADLSNGALLDLLDHPYLYLINLTALYTLLVNKLHPVSTN